MKDKRNCNNPVYPIYTPPFVAPPINYPYYPNQQYMQNISSNNIEEQLNNIQQQINLLDKRLSRLENSININAKSNYNDSNYYMV